MFISTSETLKCKSIMVTRETCYNNITYAMTNWLQLCKLVAPGLIPWILAQILKIYHKYQNVNSCAEDRCLFFCTFYFGHCVVCSSSIYGFWLPLDIFKLFFKHWWIKRYQHINNFDFVLYDSSMSYPSSLNLCSIILF